MKTIGMLGGMSWKSTLEYYKLINTGVKEALGGLHSARIILHSVDFDAIEGLMRKDDWDTIALILGEAIVGLEKAGAEFFMICTNTIHKIAPALQSIVCIPLLHIADATAEVLLENKIHKVGLLGTAFTMEQEFYTKRLQEQYGLDVMTPDGEDRAIVDSVIFTELCHGTIKEESKREYIRIIESFSERGAEAVILGCTEIGLLVQQEDVTIPLFDTTPIHASKAVELALQDDAQAQTP